MSRSIQDGMTQTAASGKTSAMPLPDGFEARMHLLMGAEAGDLISALEQPPLTGLRVNTLKVSPEDFDALSPWRLEPVPWCGAGFLVRDVERIGKHPYHAAGLYYIQEPSAMAAAEALAPQPGQWVLDLAAAPGGKFTQLLALTGDTGIAVGNEVHNRRGRILADNVERWGARNAILVSAEPALLAEQWGPTFHRVLVDAPCSGEGMFRKSPAARRDWTPETVRGCSLRQGRLLDSAAVFVRKDGLLVYSTCTFAPEENEQVVAHFLSRHRDFELIPAEIPQASAGRPDWVPAAPARQDLSLTARLWPHRVPGDGHFVAVLKRASARPAMTRVTHLRPASKRACGLWRSFLSSTLSFDPTEGRVLFESGEKLYAVPEHIPALEGIAVLRLGLWLGTLRQKRFRPSHSLALAVRPRDVSQGNLAECVLNLSPDDERVTRYLRGYPLGEAGPSGWVLVCVSGFPLGWGHRTAGIIKNGYPKGLRMH